MMKPTEISLPFSFDWLTVDDVQATYAALTTLTECCGHILAARQATADGCVEKAMASDRLANDCLERLPPAWRWDLPRG